MALQLISKSAEVKLVQMLSDLRAGASGWNAVHFHLSNLLEEYKSEYQIKIAINLIHDLLKAYDGTIFLLTDSSIVVLCRGMNQLLLDKLIFQMRYLYIDDPLVYTDTGQENPDFCSAYDLRRDWQAFYDMCSRQMTMFARKQPLAMQPLTEKIIGEPAAEKEMPRRREPKLPMLEQPTVSVGKIIDKPANMRAEEKALLSASKLVTIERDMHSIDLMQVTRRQPVCAVLPDMRIRRVFDELYIHIAHLRQMLKTDVDFFSNRWLFKYLTHALDERMMDLIRSKPEHYLGSPISINLNIETLLSSRFAEFDRALKPETKISIVIEVPVVDVFADMAAFTLARSEVQKLGYRVCLDGLTTTSFTSINRDKLGLDLLKVQWNADVQSDLKLQANKDLIAAVQTAGSNRIILCRCDNRSAVEYGHALGISLFQGRYIDHVLNPTAKVEN